MTTSAVCLYVIHSFPRLDGLYVKHYVIMLSCVLCHENDVSLRFFQVKSKYDMSGVI